jgi:hypothetical protein
MPTKRCYYCALYTWTQLGDGSWACGCGMPRVTYIRLSLLQRLELKRVAHNAAGFSHGIPELVQ